MNGSFGLVLILFSLLVGVAHRWGVSGFNTLDEAWLQFVRLAGVLGLAWCAVAVARLFFVSGMDEILPLPATPTDRLIPETSAGSAPQVSADPEAVETIKNSGLFDADWYNTTYLRFSKSPVDPLEHFLKRSNAVRLDPNPYFETSWYLEHNEDVRETGMIPLVHYIVHGAAECRSIGRRFDTAYYIAENTDVAESGVNPLLHFITEGKAEGRRGVAPSVRIARSR